MENDVLSNFQGACRKGQSCVHTSLLLQETVASALEKHNKVFVSYFDVSKAFDTDIGLTGKLWRLMYRTYTNFYCKVRIAGSFSDWYPMLCGIHQGGILSLTNYIIFINDLLVELENSKLCCQISRIQSSPAGYADDLAAATVSKNHSDRVHNIVNEYGKLWRFNFNAGKSAVMVFGEDRKTNILNSRNRMFRLGHERVKEKDTYDHVGIKMIIFNDCTTRVEEKVSKGRKTLNACMGLGIRKKGLNMATCNAIYWQVVIPTVTFGSEVWVNSEKDDEILLAFQRYSGKRIQRFPQRTPNSTSFFGLGWLKITSFIKVKKLLFIRSIVKMKNDNIIRAIFECRLHEYEKDLTIARRNIYRSPVFELLNVAKEFGVFKSIKQMILYMIPVTSKRAWSDLIWERAWHLEDINWRVSNLIQKDNDLLTSIVQDTHYLPWWRISDLDYRQTKMCETMGKIICHASLLKRDDYRLKGLPMSCRTCTKCDQYCIEDIVHVVYQCPYSQPSMNELYDEIFTKCTNARPIFEENPADVIYYLLGMNIPGLHERDTIDLWTMSGNAICKIYRMLTMDRKGVG